MKKIIISLLSAIAFWGEACPQAPHQQDDDFGELLVSIYEHGKDLDCCEANFENLFKNWIPKYIFNAKASGSVGADDSSANKKMENFVTSAQEMELISYAYVEAIKDSTLANEYINLTFSLQAVNALLLTSGGKTEAKIGGQGKKVERRYSTAVLLSRFEEDIAELRDSTGKNACIAGLEKAKTRLYEALLKGAEVYRVKLKYGGKEMESYVFCNPQTHTIIWDNIFAKIKILP